MVVTGTGQGLAIDWPLSVLPVAMSLMNMGEDSFAGRDVRAACAAVIAGMRLYLGDQVVFVLGGDRLFASFAVDADGHF